MVGLRALATIPLSMFVGAHGLHAQAPGPATYAEIAPILAQRCVMCHAGEAAAAGLRLDTYAGITRGSARGAVVKAGDPAASELIRRLRGESTPRMPMTGPPYLSDREIALFERWVAAGAPDGGAAAPLAPVPAPRPGAGEPVTYRHVAPILARRCAKCHTDNGLMGPPPEGYRLTSYESTLSAADRVRVVPGQPEASELVRRVRGQARPRMPMDGPPYLGDDEIRLLEEWVAGGARDAAGRAAKAPPGAAVRLHGRLDSRGDLDGLRLTLLPTTRIDKAPGAGDYVEVRGRVDAAGAVTVERLRRR